MKGLEHVKPWVSLYLAHLRLRDNYALLDGDKKKLRDSINRVLSDVVKQCPKVLDKGITSRFTYGSAGKCVEYRLAGHDGQKGEKISIPDLVDARLSIMALEERSNPPRLRSFTVMVEGKTKENREWWVAVHLPKGDEDGSGACGHPLLHCHVGIKDQKPELRVPLPPLPPAEILRWVLSQVIPGYEPAPWPRVKDLLVRSIVD